LTKGPIIAVVIGLLAIGVAAQPYLTVNRMRAAAERKDGEAFSEYIDFPSVRQSLKDQINAAFLQEMTKDEGKQQSGAAALGAAVGGIMVDRLADAFLEAYVTPAGITRMMAGDQPGGEGHDTGDEPGCRLMSDGSMSYESLNKFVVSTKGDAGEECRMVLRRQGIGWKVTELIIPLAQMSDDDSRKAPGDQKRQKSGKS
jgi:hypothetical protein